MNSRRIVPLWKLVERALRDRDCKIHVRTRSLAATHARTHARASKRGTFYGRLFNKYHQIAHEKNDQRLVLRCEKEERLVKVEREAKRKREGMSGEGWEGKKTRNSASRCGIMHGGVHGARI